ncbi:MAG: hypothetical protein EAZ92_01555 [Candidatus Kapaibacterium sp.]|nr:MAG: hypothetical protein EAZ92_01555 [Candidatus Kapabacteria bacterium]
MQFLLFFRPLVLPSQKALRVSCFLVSFWLVSFLLTSCVTNSQYTFDIILNKALVDSAKQVIVRYSTDTFQDSIVVAPIVSGSVISSRNLAFERIRGNYSYYPPGIPLPNASTTAPQLLLEEFNIPAGSSKEATLYLGERVRSVEVRIDGMTTYQANYVREPERRKDWYSVDYVPKKSATRYWDSKLFLGFSDVSTHIMLANETTSTFRVEYSAIHPVRGAFDSSFTLSPRQRAMLLQFNTDVASADKNFIQDMHRYITSLRVFTTSTNEKIIERSRATTPFGSGEWQYFYLPPPRQSAQYIRTIWRSDKH